MTNSPSEKEPRGSLLPSFRNRSHKEDAGDLSTRRIGESKLPPSAEKSLELRREPSQRREGQLVQGSVLQERYYILNVIGAGGMSTVYKAQDMRFAQVTRLCAVKEMINIASDPQIRQRNLRNFDREASLLATLSHPAIPQVYDYFSEGEHSYLVQEFIQGQDLESYLDTVDGFLTETQVVTWALQVCEVLLYLHNHKPHPIVFRDLKPSNIMLDDHSRIRLVDFGIAKIFQGGLKGTMIGTEGYSPPEQYRGIADPRGDIYSLGATLHHLLSKQDPRLEPPFSFQERPIYKSNPGVSDELMEIINRTLEYDIDDRFSSVEELYRALSGLGTGQGTSTSFLTGEFREPGAPEPIWKFACEDEVRSSPVLHGDTLYVGAYDNNLYALDASTGKFEWKYATEGGVGSSPLVVEGRVFFGSQDQVLYALYADTGRLIWTCPTGGPIYSSPRSEFGYVFFGSDDGKLYSLKIASGRTAWTFQAESPIRSSPTIGQEAIYVGDEGGTLYAIGTGGRMVWKFRARRGLTSTALLIKDVLFVGSKDTHMYSVDANTGWDLWRHRTGGPIVSSPALHETSLIFGSADGIIYALNANTGRVIWEYETDGQVTSSPACTQDAVYIGSTNGTFYAIDLKSGKLRWRFQTEGPVISSPYIADGVVYFGSCDYHVYALPV